MLKFQVDSLLKVQSDSSSTGFIDTNFIPETGIILNTETGQASFLQPDTNSSEIIAAPVVKRAEKQVQVKQPETSVSKSELDSTRFQKAESKAEPFNLFIYLKKTDSSLVRFQGTVLKSKDSVPTTAYSGPRIINNRTNFQKAWVLGIALIAVLVFITVRIFYQKYLVGIVNSVVNIQISEKLMREKNVIIKRVFWFMNINFLISISLFAYVFMQNMQIIHSQFPGQNSFIVFVKLLVIITIVLIIRFGLIHLIGLIFDSAPLFREYLHNTYIINKNLGLYLLPLVISVFYLSQPMADVVLYLAISFVVIAMLYKYLRALQVIMKYNVFLFYTFLYLCTLEILPFLAGVKFVLSLR